MRWHVFRYVPVEQQVRQMPIVLLFANAKDQMSMNDTEGMDVSNTQSDMSEQNVGQAVANDVMSFADYDGLVYEASFDSSTMSLHSEGDKLIVYLVAEHDINGNSGFFDGEVELTAEQCSRIDGQYSFRGARSVDDTANVEIDFHDDGSALYAITKDDGSYGSNTVICAELAARATADYEESLQEADNSILANYAGEYHDTGRDSFVIEMDNATGEYKITMVKLYSAQDWSEETDRDGERFYDSPIIESIKDCGDYIVVKTISQYTAANGTFKIHFDGTAEVEYTGFSSPTTSDGNFSGTLWK